SAAVYQIGRRRALALVEHPTRLNSLPGYYGSYLILWAIVPAVLILAVWLAVEPQVTDAMLRQSLPQEVQAQEKERLNLYLNDVKNLATGNIVSRTPSPELQRAADRYAELRQQGALARWGLLAALASLGLILGRRWISPQLRAMIKVERAFSILLLSCSTIAILTTLGIVLSLLFEAIRFFGQVPITEFLFGTEWSPQTALRADQVGSSGSFGAVPLFTGTLLISAIAMVVAAPVGLLSAIYMAEYASPRVRTVLKPMLEILAGIPTVVYGFFAALTVAPFLREMGVTLGLDIASESALAAGGVMGIMIIPFVSSLSDDVITAVPKGLREASTGLGATPSETIRKVVFPAALPGIVGGILLAVSRAIGETMIVVMAAGLAANLTANPLENVTTVTVQIVTLLVGDQEFDSAKTLSAFALGLVLFLVTLVLNIIALHVVRKYREQYD
ncbi:MAG: phosphate ABC transporter permease subunit PstC, partial [Acidobacteriota bacterium]|nr:phosphate ABC transporter permease subunit PstC [Acidobacteriota bacterium]